MGEINHVALKTRATNAARRACSPAWSADTWGIAPGRIELIGNHTDYNGGPVLAAAIDRVVAVGVGPGSDLTHINLATADMAGKPQSIEPATLGDWRATPHDRGPVVYVRGIVAALAARGIPYRSGVSLAVAGDIPRGFGMSSSAALCVATILALTIDDLPPSEIVAIAREAEHRAGAMVGAMDQSASVAGHVIRFDGRDNSFVPLEPNLGDHVFAVADSGVQRSLRRSSYGARVTESEAARDALGRLTGRDLPYLAAIAPDWDEVATLAQGSLDPTLFHRARHIATETNRVHASESAMMDGAWEAFGELMNASGESSARDYAISHPEVERLVAILREQDGVLGARMMGGGEGGPALALLRRDAVNDVAAALDTSFYATATKRPGEKPFQTCSFGPGAHRDIS